MKNLEMYGVQEMNANEIKNVYGGVSWWAYAQEAFNTLTSDFIGCLAVGLCAGPCLIAIGLDATYKYFTQ